jgi:hypothetical protein
MVIESLPSISAMVDLPFAGPPNSSSDPLDASNLSSYPSVIPTFVIDS